MLCHLSLCFPPVAAACSFCHFLGHGFPACRHGGFRWTCHFLHGLWLALPCFGNQGLFLPGRRIASGPLSDCSGLPAVGRCWLTTGRIDTVMPHRRRNILRSFRDRHLGSLLCLACQLPLPLPPEGGFCFALCRRKGVGCPGQNFPGGSLRQAGSLFIGGFLAGPLPVPLPPQYRTDRAVLSGSVCCALLPGRLLPGFYPVYFLSLSDIQYFQHLQSRKICPNLGRIQSHKSSLKLLKIRPNLGQISLKL